MQIFGFLVFFLVIIFYLNLEIHYTFAENRIVRKFKKSKNKSLIKNILNGDAKSYICVLFKYSYGLIIDLIIFTLSSIISWFFYICFMFDFKWSWILLLAIVLYSLLLVYFSIRVFSKKYKLYYIRKRIKFINKVITDKTSGNFNKNINLSLINESLIKFKLIELNPTSKYDKKYVRKINSVFDKVNELLKENDQEMLLPYMMQFCYYIIIYQNGNNNELNKYVSSIPNFFSFNDETSSI